MIKKLNPIEKYHLNKMMILKILVKDNFTCKDLERKLDLNKQTIYKHLSKMRDESLISKPNGPFISITSKGIKYLRDGK